MTDRIAFASTATVEGRNIRGSVVVAGSRTWRNNEWLEVDPAALVKADASNVLGLFDHDPSKLLGRTSNGTLEFTRTEQGIDYEIRNVPNTTAGNDALELAKGGYLNGSSFAIEGLRSEFSTDPDGTRVRRITSIKRLADISPVFDPAFTSSSVAAFSKESEVVTDEIKEPVPAPAAEIKEPVAAPAKFTQSDTADTAEAFARKQDLAGLEQAMENLIAGGLDTAARQETYNAFAKVFDERKKVDAEARERAERIALAHALRTGRGPKAPAQAEMFASEDYTHAFSRYIRTGDRALMEQFAQSIAGDGTQGGYTVPDSFLTKIVERMKAYGGVQRVADSITTADGRSLEWPSNDDTANSAAIATEGSAVASGGADLVFGTVNLGAYTYDATGTGNVPLKVSKELLQDTAFDMESFISRKLGERLGRKMAADFATADGSSKPKGLLNKTADTMTATTMYAALVEHYFQVDQAYREGDNVGWILGDTTLAKIFNSMDDNGRPLFQPAGTASGASGPAGFLLGRPVTLDQGAGDLVGFGDFRAGFIIRYVRGVTIDVDPYTLISSRQIAYHGWARADSDVQDAYAYSVSSYASVTADAEA